MPYPKSEIWRYWPLVALLSAIAGCAFQYTQTIGMGVGRITDKLDSYRCRSAYRNGYTAALDSIAKRTDHKPEAKR